MAQDFGSTMSGMLVKGVPMIVIGLIVIVAITGLTIFSIWMYRKKRWNLKLTIKFPRSDGKIILEEKAKGAWDAENGWITVKRKGVKAVETRPIDPKKWIRGTDRATLIQVGPEDYIIASEDSYKIVRDEETGTEIAIMDVIADVGKRKTWRNYTERMGKRTFTIKRFWDEYQGQIILAVVVFVIFLGFSILWMRMPSLCPPCSCSASLIPIALRRKK
jgi:hypothetical protein